MRIRLKSLAMTAAVLAGTAGLAAAQDGRYYDHDDDYRYQNRSYDNDDDRYEKIEQDSQHQGLVILIFHSKLVLLNRV